MSIDSIGNFLTIIRNDLLVFKPFSEAPYSRLREKIAQILKREGFIKDIIIDGEGVSRKIRVLLKYKEGESVIHELVRVSTPGRRTYRGSSDLKPVIGGLGIAILTTNLGVITDKEARERQVGGEVLCTVW